MNYSTRRQRESWPSPERETWDRLKDLEHTADEHSDRLDSHDTQLKWHTSALGLVLWLILQGKAVEYMPQVAAFTAMVIEGLKR